MMELNYFLNLPASNFFQKLADIRVLDPCLGIFLQFLATAREIALRDQQVAFEQAGAKVPRIKIQGNLQRITL